MLTVILRMPTGDDEFSPPDQCGIAIGSALVTLGLFPIDLCLGLYLIGIESIWLNTNMNSSTYKEVHGFAYFDEHYARVLASEG